MKAQHLSSGETALTDWQISLLEDFVKQFRAAKPDCHEKIIKNAVVCIKSAWAEDVEFDGETVESVRELSVKICYSQMILAYSHIPVWET